MYTLLKPEIVSLRVLRVEFFLNMKKVFFYEMNLL